MKLLMQKQLQQLLQHLRQPLQLKQFRVLPRNKLEAILENPPLLMTARRVFQFEPITHDCDTFNSRSG